MELLHEVSVESPETEQFIEEHLEQKFLKENISVEDVIYFFYKPSTKELPQKTFYCVVLGFKAETFLLELHLTKYVKRYNL